MWSEETSKGFESRKCRARLEQFCKGTGVDLGCGDEKVVPGAIGVDRAGKEVNVAGDITSLPIFADGAFDYVFSSHALEDQVDTVATLREWCRLVRPGGYLVLYLPHKNFYPNIGMPGSNPNHRYDFLPEDVLRPLAFLDGMMFMHVESHNENDEYAFDLVARKVDFQSDRERLITTVSNLNYLPEDPVLLGRLKDLRTKVDTVQVQRLGMLGDMLMTLPAVSLLKKKHDVLIYLTDPKWLPLIADHPDIDVVRYANPPGTHPGEKGFAQWPDTDIYFRYPDRKVQDTKHLTEWFCEQAGVPPSGDIYYPVDPNVWKTLGGIVGKVGMPYIVVHPYPGFTINKAWPPRQWGRLCQRLIMEGYRVIQVGDQKEEPVLKESNNFTCAAGMTNLMGLAALIGRAQALICGDSVTNHLSQAMKTRAVVIFGSTCPKSSGYDQNINIFQGVKCQPCYMEDKICNHRACLDGVTVEQVYDALMSILKDEQHNLRIPT